MEEETHINFYVDSDAVSEWKDYASRHLDEVGQGILVNHDDEINAFLMYEPRKKVFKSDIEKGYISDIYVKPGKRRQGIGRALMIEALRVMKESYDRIQLQVFANNRNAITLYRSLGFRDFSLILDYK